MLCFPGGGIFLGRHIFTFTTDEYEYEQEDEHESYGRRKTQRKRSKSKKGVFKKGDKKSKKSKSPKSSKSSNSDDPPKPFDCSSPANIYKLLETTAIDMNNPGYDFFTGVGFVNALAAVEKLIELVNDPVAAAEFEGTLDDDNGDDDDDGDEDDSDGDDDEEEERQRKQCPIDNFLSPIISSFVEPFDPNPIPSL